MNAAETQSKIAGAVLALILVVTVAAGAWQAGVSHPAIARQGERAAAERHFWRAVAGEESTSAASVENQLAEDLAATPKGELGKFRGDSNRYGGISDAIGYDPFDGVGLNCSECGPLKESVRQRVTLAKSGGIGRVLATVPVASQNPAFVLTPFGINAFVWIAGLWILVGHASYLAAGGRSKRDARMWLSAPGLAAWSSVSAWKADQRDRDQISSVFPDAVKQIDEVDSFIGKLPSSSPTVQRLRTLRDQVEAELRRQAQESAYNRDDDKLADMTARLSAMAEALQDRSESFDEVNEIDHQSGIDPHTGQVAQG